MSDPFEYHFKSTSRAELPSTASLSLPVQQYMVLKLHTMAQTTVFPFEIGAYPKLCFPNGSVNLFAGYSLPRVIPHNRPETPPLPKMIPRLYTLPEPPLDFTIGRSAIAHVFFHFHGASVNSPSSLSLH